MRIAFDPGHGAGKNRYQNYCEGDTMLELGKRLIKAIPNSFLTRTDGTDITLATRAIKAKQGKADILISLHTDWPVTGTLTIYSIHRPQDKDLAERIGQAVAKALGTYFRGAITRKSALGNWDYYGIIRNGVKQGIPTIIVEHCGHTEMAVDTDKKINTIVEVYANLFASQTDRSERERDIVLLKVGSRGEEVKALQNNLNKLGFNCGIADGIFGAKTEAAVKAFQKAYGLTVDGIAGPATLGKITELLKQMEQQQNDKALQDNINQLETQVRTLQDRVKQLEAELQSANAKIITAENRANDAEKRLADYKAFFANFKKIISEV